MLTLTQLSELGKINEIDIYSGISLPEGSPLDRSVLINSIIMRCGLNYPLYADPAVMANAISLWSAKNQYTFEHVAKVYEASYSPIENYDRYEDMSSNRDRGLTDDTYGYGNKNDSIISNRTTGHSGTDTTTNETTVSAFNATTYQPDNKLTSSLLHGESVSDSGSSNRTSNTSSNSKKTISENEKTTQDNHIRGNIGVTTATAMQSEEYEFLKNYNPYEFLAGLFENELTLFVF